MFLSLHCSNTLLAVRAYLPERYVAIVTIFASSKFLRSRRSLSPVIRWDAFPSTESDNRKLSFGALQAVIELVTSINSARKLNSCNRSCKSAKVKYYLNLGLLATSMNSSSSSWLKSNVMDWSASSLSRVEKSLVNKKLIQRFVSTMTLSFVFAIAFCSYCFNFFCDVI